MSQNTMPTSQPSFLPEVVGISELDCGPASLKALLERLGVSASFGQQMSTVGVQKNARCGDSRHPLLGIHEIDGKSIRIKNVTLKMYSAEPACLDNKTVKRKLQELETFQQIGVLPFDLALTTRYIRGSFCDKGGGFHHNYFWGISFSSNEFPHYVKTTGKGCGESVYLAHEQQESFQRIELINGICLYGNEKFRLETQTGHWISLTEPNFGIQEPIRDISVDASFSLYEVDALMGLSSFINRLSERNGKIDTIHIEIPKGQYYLSLAEAYQNHYLSPEIFQQCLAEIDARHELVFQAYRKRLRIENIRRIAPLAGVEEYFLDAAHKKQPICFDRVQAILWRDETWQKILSIYPATQWKELGDLSHVFVFLALGRREPHKAVLQIDDPIEEKIRIEASRMIERLGVRANYRIWGMYPLQHVVLNPELYPDSDLYYGPNIKLDVSMIRKIISQSRRNGTHAVLDGAGLPKSSQEVDR